MANVQSFPLFRLPTLAYENVVDLLHLKEKFDLSATSKKVTLIIKRYIQLKKHQLVIFLFCTVDYSARIYVHIDRGDKSHIKESNSWVYDLGQDNNKIVDPTIRQITHIASVAPTASLRLKFSQPLNLEFVPLAERLNLTLKSVEIYLMEYIPDDDMCREVFKYSKNAQSLIYHRETEYDFTMDPDAMGSYSFDVLELSEVPWITGNHLIKCFTNCKYIKFTSTKLSDQEMNDFLKHWTEGSKIQEFLILVNEPVFQMANVLAGITSVPHPYVYDKTFVEIASPGYVIKNTEGLEAVIHLTDDSFHLTTDFEIVDENFIVEESFDDDEEEDSDGED